MGDSDRLREDGQLTVHVEPDGEELLVRAFGELDLSNARTLEVELRRALGADGPGVILDLSGLSFIDSTGLRVLLLMAKQSSRNGDGLCILRGSEAVERAIEVAGVEDLLPLAD